MMVSCLEHVINVEVIQNGSKALTIEAPGAQFDQLKKIRDQCREAAADAKGKMDKAAAAAGKEAEDSGTQAAGAAAGLASMAGLGMGAAMAAANAVKTAADTAGDVASAVTGAAGDAIAKGFTLVADGLDGCIKPVEDDFSQVAQELVKDQKAAIFEIYNSVIENCSFKNALGFVRGEEPFGAEQYAKCRPCEISEAFNSVCADDLAEQLLPKVKDFIKASKAAKAWNAAIEKYNMANEKLAATEATSKMAGEPIKLDIEVYIVKAVIAKLTKMMGEHEALCRKEPAGKVKQKNATFEACFCGDEITVGAFQNFKKGA